MDKRKVTNTIIIRSGKGIREIPRPKVNERTSQFSIKSAKQNSAQDSTKLKS